jgi:hypothetical protein
MTVIPWQFESLQYTVGMPVEGSLQLLTRHTWAVGVAAGVGVKGGQPVEHS